LRQKLKTILEKRASKKAKKANAAKSPNARVQKRKASKKHQKSIQKTPTNEKHVQKSIQKDSKKSKRLQKYGPPAASAHRGLRYPAGVCRELAEWRPKGIPTSANPTRSIL